MTDDKQPIDQLIDSYVEQTASSSLDKITYQLIEDYMEQRESRSLDKLFDALAKAQLNMEEARTDSKNPFFRSNYADFSSIVRASRKPLAEQGLAITQIIFEDHKGRLVLRTRLGHTSGQWIDSFVPVGECKNKEGKSDIQAFGSKLTYLKRYTYAAIAGVVAAGEDDDGEKAMERRKTTTERLSELEKVTP
ncbi:MAG: ERF family protein [Halobacteriovoraceae bacterium]|nr:ERF family protein [Halobacteriovoraceae bacterium]